MKTISSRPRSRAHFDSLDQEVFLNLWRTYDRLRMLEEELFAQHDLTPQQYNVLRLLRAEAPGKLLTRALALRLVSRAPDITRILDKLEQAGLVTRDRPQHNRRAVEVGITPAGLALLRNLDGPVRDCHARQLGHLTVAQRKQLIALLHAARTPHEPADSRWR